MNGTSNTNALPDGSPSMADLMARAAYLVRAAAAERLPEPGEVAVSVERIEVHVASLTDLIAWGRWLKATVIVVDQGEIEWSFLIFEATAAPAFIGPVRVSAAEWRPDAGVPAVSLVPDSDPSLPGLSVVAS